jgi:CRP-like cAMP-binding protein
MYEKWLNVLYKCALFQGISSCELQTMLECIRPRICEYKKNENITLEGEKYEGVGIVLKGSASITKENAAGSRIIMAMANPSDIFGEIAAFSKHSTWPATVVAQDNCTVMFLPPEKIVNECEKLCISHKTLVNNMLGIVSEKALILNKKVEYLTIRSLRGKICSFFLEQYKAHGSATFMMPMKRNELADFLNVSRPSLSREMCRMRDEGIIDFHRSSIRIQNIDLLKSVAE